jgi:hypothetical protein
MDTNSQRNMTLTVFYLLNGNVETDVRTGVNFRWRTKDGTVCVFEHDTEHQFVWTKTYLFPITVEMSS